MPVLRLSNENGNERRKERCASGSVVTVPPFPSLLPQPQASATIPILSLFVAPGPTANTGAVGCCPGLLLFLGLRGRGRATLLLRPTPWFLGSIICFLLWGLLGRRRRATSFLWSSSPSLGFLRCLFTLRLVFCSALVASFGRVFGLLGLLGLSVGFFLLRTVGFLLDVELGLLLDYIVARTRDVDGWIFGVAFALDGVAALGLDRDFAIGFLLGDLTRWLTTAVVPRD